MNWDDRVFPYLWVWEPDCGAMGYPWYGRNYTLGMEPWSHLSENLEEVVKEGTGILIKPGESILTHLEAYVCTEKP